MFLVLLSAWTAIRILFTSTAVGNTVVTYNFIPAHYFGFLALAICLVSYFVLRRAYKFVLGATLSLGLFSVLNFTLSQNTVGFKFGVVDISFEPVSLIMILLVAILNQDKISQLLHSNTPKTTAQDEQREFAIELAKYKSQYSNASTEELEKVSEDPRFKPAAVEAAKQLLKNRKSQGGNPASV